VGPEEKGEAMFLRQFSKFPNRMRKTNQLLLQPVCISRSYSQKKTEKNEIEAEIIREKVHLEPKEDHSSTSTGLISFFKNKISKAKEYFGFDEKTQQKKKEEKVINELIDNTLKSVGLSGGVVGYTVRTLIKATTKVAATAITEINQDLESIQEETGRILAENRLVQQIVGENIRCETPYHLSTNTSNVNGRIKKRFQLRMAVSGSKESECVVSVDATIDQEELYLNSILFQNKVTKFDIECSDQPAKKRVVIDA
jgi:hypothetical protein